MPLITLILPPRSRSDTLKGNQIVRLLEPSRTFTGECSAWLRRGVTGQLAISGNGHSVLFIDRRIRPPSEIAEVLQVSPTTLASIASGTQHSAIEGRWLKPHVPRQVPLTKDEIAAQRENVRASWADRLVFREETRDASGALISKGLRTPQIGALHAILAHWTVTTQPATVVMPTGTGKTETMVASMLVTRPPCLLVVVPTDALRLQVAEKFASLGMLPIIDVLQPGETKFPAVGIVRRKPATTEDVEDLFSRCNVVVTTMAIAGQASPEVQAAMARSASHLMIDEAHHISAATWSQFRERFRDKPILQFTATPFRRDRKHVDGKVIYSYPLRKAQAEGLFQRVNFRPILEFGPPKAADAAIAEAAVAQLDADLAAGYDHLLLARAETIDRVEQVYAAYVAVDAMRKAAGKPSLRPQIVHSRQSKAASATALQMIRSRSARVVVCVDMFGEGFDLPSLKVAALHDVHKSLAITLQFVGRFTRAVSHLGEATVIANLGSADVEESLRTLYAEDADWNVVLRNLSTGATTRQIERSDFLNRFDVPPAEIPLQNVTPAMSTVIYRTPTAEWRPDHIVKVIGQDRLQGRLSINHHDKVAVFVTREVEEVEWGEVREIADVTWDLYVVHWDENAHLLYINSSNNRSLHDKLAVSIGGPDVALIRGEAVFRVYHQVRRLVLLSLGLKHAIGRNIQFTMYVGADVLGNLPGASQSNKIKSNMFGYGFEGGARAGFGCSYKGRVWNNKFAHDLVDWLEWAHGVGAKLTNEKIDTSEALRFALIPKRATSRPQLVPFAIDWPYELYQRNEETVTFTFPGTSATLLHVGLELESHSDAGPLRFRVFCDAESVSYEVAFSADRVTYVPVDKEVLITTGKKGRPLSEFFNDNDPPIYFANGASLHGDALLELPADYAPPFHATQIEIGDWQGVDITRESQGFGKDPATVQRRVIENLLKLVTPPDILFDDDSSGEAADIVAVWSTGGKIQIDLYHCKFSGKDYAGGRVDDLYQVCGQAQKSVHWKNSLEAFLLHLDRRETDHQAKYQRTRFERGDLALLRNIRRRAGSLEPHWNIAIVQPGLSAGKASAEQLGLLAVTELFLRETYAVPFRVIGSP